jgi:hypothetical protein
VGAIQANQATRAESSAALQKVLAFVLTCTIPLIVLVLAWDIMLTLALKIFSPESWPRVNARLLRLQAALQEKKVNMPHSLSMFYKWKNQRKRDAMPIFNSASRTQPSPSDAGAHTYIYICRDSSHTINLLTDMGRIISFLMLSGAKMPKFEAVPDQEDEWVQWLYQNPDVQDNMQQLPAESGGGEGMLPISDIFHLFIMHLHILSCQFPSLDTECFRRRKFN